MTRLRSWMNVVHIVKYYILSAVTLTACFQANKPRSTNTPDVEMACRLPSLWLPVRISDFTFPRQGMLRVEASERDEGWLAIEDRLFDLHSLHDILMPGALGEGAAAVCSSLTFASNRALGDTVEAVCTSQALARNRAVASRTEPMCTSLESGGAPLDSLDSTEEGAFDERRYHNNMLHVSVILDETLRDEIYNKNAFIKEMYREAAEAACIKRYTPATRTNACRLMAGMLARVGTMCERTVALIKQGGLHDNHYRDSRFAGSCSHLSLAMADIGATAWDLKFSRPLTPPPLEGCRVAGGRPGIDAKAANWWAVDAVRPSTTRGRRLADIYEIACDDARFSGPEFCPSPQLIP